MPYRDYKLLIRLGLASKQGRENRNLNTKSVQNKCVLQREKAQKILCSRSRVTEVLYETFKTRKMLGEKHETHYTTHFNSSELTPLLNLVLLATIIEFCYVSSKNHLTQT